MTLAWQATRLSQPLRAKKFKQKPVILWFTGPACAGKSTTANALEKCLFNMGYSTYTLDSDNLCQGICQELSDDNEGRTEYVRRAGEMARLFLDAGLITLVSVISPKESDRRMVRAMVNQDQFLEVYVKTPHEICLKRDTKGCYAKVASGDAEDFKGVGVNYEEPTHPEFEIDTVNFSTRKVVEEIIIGLRQAEIISN